MDFNAYFGKRWFEPDATFLTILLLTLIFFFGSILFLANWQFTYQNDLKVKLNQQLKAYILQLDTPPQSAPPLKTNAIPQIKSGAEIAVVPKKTPLNEQDVYADLPEIDIEGIEVEELGSDVPVIPQTRFFRGTNRTTTTYDASDLEDLMRDPYSYQINRDAQLYIATTEELSSAVGTGPRGYRDQDEVMQVIYSQSSLIESCYNKAARSAVVSKGMVKVSFKISPLGYVIKESIKVLDSTIKNRNVVQCIIKQIRRWRSFQKLDPQMGIASITHKFVFN